MACTDGLDVDLARGDSGTVAGCSLLFFYPRTGVPGQPLNRGFGGEDWDEIPGARGCTPQSCGFRDVFEEFEKRGIQILGVSTNTREHQLAFKLRMKMPFEFLSDSDLNLTRALRLPTFEFPVESGGPTTLLRRMAMYVEQGRIVKVWYPVFPPDKNAEMVLHWLRARSPESAGAQTVSIRCIEARDLTWVREELVRNWHATQISSRGNWFDADRLPGFIAELGAERVGLLTHTNVETREACEVVTVSSRAEGAGVGTRLLEACVGAAREAGCSRAFLTTTNDNLRAIGFYQRCGWSIAAVYPKAMDIARRVQPSIPIMGMNQIPVRDEIELEFVLDDASTLD